MTVNQYHSQKKGIMSIAKMAIELCSVLYVTVEVTLCFKIS